jgi:ABC-type transport system involved in multi-copper enzyme maturation permease subunit
MVTRILLIALNTYRENVRARVLYGLLALALGAAGYSLVIGTLSLHQEARVVADIGAGSISLFSILVAIVLGATTLHREIELKTVFPILTRRIHRHEYLVGKYLGTLATLSAFVAIDGAAVLGILATQSTQKPVFLALVLNGSAILLILAMWRARFTRVFVLLPWSWALFFAMVVVAAPAGADRQYVIASAMLTMCEVGIVTAVATFFSSFSSPFLTAIFTLGVWLVGRSAETLGNLPVRVFGQSLHNTGATISRVLPNLQAYVPPRPILLGEVAESPVWSVVTTAAMNAFFYAVLLMTLSAVIFRRRDFQ